ADQTSTVGEPRRQPRSEQHRRDDGRPVRSRPKGIKMTDTARFAGRNAIVTGAASGIGRATALRLASEGAAVVCLDVADAVDDTVSAIVEAGGKATALRVDVSDEASVADAVAAVRSDLGPVTVLANVA